MSQNRYAYYGSKFSAICEKCDKRPVPSQYHKGRSARKYSADEIRYMIREKLKDANKLV